MEPRRLDLSPRKRVADPALGVHSQGRQVGALCRARTHGGQQWCRPGSGQPAAASQSPLALCSPWGCVHRSQKPQDPKNNASAESPPQQWAADNPRMRTRGSPSAAGSRVCTLGLGLNPSFGCSQPWGALNCFLGAWESCGTGRDEVTHRSLCGWHTHGCRQPLERIAQRGKGRSQGHTAEMHRTPRSSSRVLTPGTATLGGDRSPHSWRRPPGVECSQLPPVLQARRAAHPAGSPASPATPAAEALRTLMGDKGAAVAGAWRSAGSFPSLQQRTDLAGGQAGRRIPLPRLWPGRLSRTVWTGLRSQRLPHLQTLVAGQPSTSTKCSSSL